MWASQHAITSSLVVLVEVQARLVSDIFFTVLINSDAPYYLFVGYTFFTI